MILGKKAKKLCSGIMAAMLLMQPLTQPVMVHAGAVGPVGGDEATTGHTYHFSTLNESSSEDGTQANPYKSLTKISELNIQPGDKILLERGSEFNNQYIHLIGKGDNNGEPIIIEPYGEGTERPCINTNGNGVWEQDYRGQLDSPAHKKQGNVSSAILLRDTENIKIRGLEITNYENLEVGSTAFKDPNRMDRTGVAGMAQNRGTLENILLDDLYIHGVTGNIINKHMLNGGIYFICALPDSVSTNNDAIEAANVPKFDGLTIQNCHVEDVSRWGIAVAYTIYWNKFTSMAISDDVAQTYGSSNVVIKNNYLKDVGGDAITTMYCYRPLVESNVSQGAAKYIRSDLFPSGAHRVAAGIWPWKCKDSIFQKNECFDTLNHLSGNQDAQAWDADYGDGTIYQYNYSHGNTGSCIMFCGAQAYRTTFRYNISQNDLDGMFCVAGNPDAHIYNNTFYIKEGVDVISTAMSGGAARIENNIFYYTGKTPKVERWYYNTNTQVYDNNLYYNYASVPDRDQNAVIGDGKLIFQNEGTAPTAALESGRVHDISVFDGYKLAPGSPAIGAGKTITDANGYTMDANYKDFFGQVLDGTREIGAAEAEASPAAVLRLLSNVYEIQTGGTEGTNTISGLESNTTLETFRENLIYQDGGVVTVKNGGNAVPEGTVVRYPMTVELAIGGETITYTLIPNTEAELLEAVFMVKDTESVKEIYVPSTEKNPCTVQNLVAGLRVSNGAVVTVLNGDTPVTEENVADGMTLKIAAEDGRTEKNYTIRVKNVYHWTGDYVDAQQGNVWFAQAKSGDADYVNLTSYDARWATWNSSEDYTCVGAEGEKNQVTENKNGLICDFRSADPTPAMAFRAPMSGKVTFALKDTEPYLRQSGNSGGSVRLSLYVNNETEPRQSCEMSESMQKAAFPQIELEVQKGDYIRLQALAVGTPSKPSVYATPIITYLNEEPSEQGPDTPEAPAAPTNVTAGEITQTSVKLSWTAPQGSQAAKYEIYNGAEKLAEVEGNTTTAVVNGLTAETQYTLTVKTVDAAGNQSEGADVTFTTLQEEAPPEDTTAEKQQLQALITQAEKKIAEGKYTEASVKAVQDQIDASRALLEAAAPTRAQLTKALGDLNKAVGELKEKEDPTPTPPAKWIFEDVEEIPGHWKYENIKYVYEKNIMNGISGTKLFDPDAKLNRAMFATVLYRMAGSPKITFVNKFKDVKDGEYYSEAIIWANSKGIVEGYSNGNYGVQDNITREQIAKMLNLYAKVQNYDINDKKDLGSFTDADKVSGWATGFMQWATAVEMITGKPNEDGKTYRLDPKGQATRAECAKMLTMFSKKYEQ